MIQPVFAHYQGNAYADDQNGTGDVYYRRRIYAYMAVLWIVIIIMRFRRFKVLGGVEPNKIAAPISP